MPIPIISNFSVNVPEPIDTRVVSTSSNAMYNMLYPYRGLTTYRTDTNLNYTYNGTTWSITSNGIYGGSGKLIQNETIVDFGTLSTTQDATSRKLTMLSFTENTGDYGLYLSQYFERHTGDASGIPFTGQYKTQLIFQDNVENETFNGPYIIYNPPPQNGHGPGAISFGAYSFISGASYERLRIEGTGLIRFKSVLTPVDDSYKTLNIGIDNTTQTKPFIGYNWTGADSENAQLQEASYIEFNESVISLNSYNGLSSTTMANFQRGLVTLNGGLQVIGGTISTSRSMQFGTDDSGVYFVRTPNNFGIRYDGQRKYAELVGSVTGTQPSGLLRWGPVNGLLGMTVLSNMTFTQSFTTLFASTVRSEFKTQLWDNVFNPDYEKIGTQIALKSSKKTTFSDLYFTRVTTEDAKNDGNVGGGENDTSAIAGNIRVLQVGYPGDNNDSSTTLEWRILIGTSYIVNQTIEATFAKNTFEAPAKDYDRIYYFYLDGMRRHIQHQVRWWLGEPSPTGGYRYVQIGNIETGNKENYGNETTSYGNASYRSRFYSQTVFVPAFMTFRIQFRFHVSVNFTSASTQANSPRVFVNVIRSGKFTRLPYAQPTEPTTPLKNTSVSGSGLGYPGSTSESGGGVVVVVGGVGVV